MAVQVCYQLFHENRLIGEGRIETPFTVGRQSEGVDSEPVSVFVLQGQSAQLASNEYAPRKLVIVPLSDRAVPRLSLKVDVDSSGNLLAQNVHRAVDLQLPNRSLIRPFEQLTLGIQGTVCFPNEYQLYLTCDEQGQIPPTAKFILAPPNAVDGPRTNRQESRFRSVSAQAGMPPVVRHKSNREYDDGQVFEANLPQLDAGDQSMLFSRKFENPSETDYRKIAVGLVRTALEAFKESPGSKEFFAAAGQAAIRMIDLDRVAVLRKINGEWRCRSLSFRPGVDQAPAAARDFSQTLLDRMELSGKTMFVDPNRNSQSNWKSITEIDRAVVSPIFGENKAVIGALYGDRLLGGTAVSQPIGDLEAALLEVLATGISSSLAIKQEQQFRSSMTQFFSPVVLAQLKQDRSLLNGRVADVSVLFCDIRGFSSVTEKIGPTKAIEWINDVFTTLSECVMAQDGVLVNYIGDELLAMWGAPGAQPDHATRACKAALDMLAQLKPLSEKWRDTIPDRFGFGIGINSGPACVGNTGSKKLFKYGPIGNTVNLASRVQGITKQIGVPGLMTGETAQSLANSDSNLRTRRLAKVRVVGIQQPVDLYELCGNENPPGLCQRYEEALQAYEEGKLKATAGQLASMVQDYPDDRPTVILLSRAVQLLTQSDREYDPVWNLKEK